MIYRNRFIQLYLHTDFEIIRNPLFRLPVFFGGNSPHPKSPTASPRALRQQVEESPFRGVEHRPRKFNMIIRWVPNCVPEASGGLFGASLWPLGASWRPLGAFWVGGLFGRKARIVGSCSPSWAYFGAVLGFSWAALGRIGSILAASWDVLGASWERLGTSCVSSWKTTRKISISLPKSEQQNLKNH